MSEIHPAGVRHSVRAGKAVAPCDLRLKDGRTLVCYVVHTFDVGGLQRCVARLVNHLDRTRFLPMIVCLNRDGSASQWISEPDVRVIELRKNNRNDLFVVKRLASVLRQHAVDIVHSHNWGTLVETVLARRRAGVPFHAHAERGTVLGTVSFDSLRSRLRGRIAGWALKTTDSVVTVASSVQHRLETRCGYPATQSKCIPNGVEIPELSNAARHRQRIRSSLGISDGVVVLTSVGRLASIKDFPSILQAMQQDVLRSHGTHLILVGDGPERDVLRDALNGSGIADRVHLVGHQEDVTPWLAASDIYVNSSISEGMSQSILEAMAAGLPLVVTDVGDSASLVSGDRRCGLVVPARSPSAMAEALTELVTSVAQRTLFSKQARLRIETDYTVDRMVQRHEQLYLEMMSMQ